VTETEPNWDDRHRDVKALGILRTLQNSCGEDIVRGKWLDVGCGSGLIAATLAQHVDQVQGVDPEPWGRWIELENAVDNLRLHAGGVDNLRSIITDSSVDVAICNQVYEHVPDPKKLVSELFRVLKPTGICYFAGPNLLWPIEPHVFMPLVHWLPREGVIRVFSQLGVERIKNLDAWSLDCWRLVRLLKNAGFQVAPALQARANAGLSLGEDGIAMQIASRLPAWLERSTLALHPSFVFLLRKKAVR
jgi:ubiquinone/menaquinone biosynthesis C-methylase UbiE